MAYSHSHLWRVMEETAAETYASGSLGRGLDQALEPIYDIKIWRLSLEAGGVTGAAAGGYVVGDAVTGDGLR